jgi:hypothetical protein
VQSYLQGHDIQKDVPLERTFQAGFEKWSKARINTAGISRSPLKTPMNRTIRTLLFMLLFGVGVGSLALATLCDDLHHYYQQRRNLAIAEIQMDVLRGYNADYDGLLAHLKGDPNAIRRFEHIVLGKQPEEPNSIFPKASLNVLMQTQKTMTSYREPGPVPEIPAWVQRIRKPSRRRAMFASGGALVLIAILWFGMDRRRPTAAS